MCIYDTGPLDCEHGTSPPSVEYLLSELKSGACSRPLPKCSPSPNVPCPRTGSGVTFAHWKRVETWSPRCVHTRPKFHALRHPASIPTIGTGLNLFVPAPVRVGARARPAFSLSYKCAICALDVFSCCFVHYCIPEYIRLCLRRHIPRCAGHE